VNFGGQVVVSAGAAGAVALSQGTSLDGVRVATAVSGGAGLTVRELVQRDSANGLLQAVRLAVDGQLLSTASGTESQLLMGTSAADLLEGGSAGDDLDGGAGNDVLQGNAGRDILRGGFGSDTLQGGAGDDNLFGGVDGQSDAATDTFVFNLGDGNDTVQFGQGGQGVLRFGAGITRESLLVTNLGGATDSTRLIKIAYSAADSVIIEAGSDSRLTSVMFADGSSATRAELIAVTPAYTAGNDSVTGAAGADVLDGGAGNDTLRGLDGNDTLTGGEGNDVLAGGAGHNTYVFAPVSGTDEITPTGGEVAMLRFTDAVPGAIRASLQGNDLWLIQAGGERVRVTGYTNLPALAGWSVVSAGGAAQTLGELLAASAAGNALAARRDNFLAEQRLTLGSQRIDQNLNPAAPTDSYRHFRTESSVTVDVVSYSRVPQYQQTTTERINIPPELLRILEGSADPANGGQGWYSVPSMFVETSTANRLVGWNYVKSTSTVTVTGGSNAQLIVSGTAGNDTLTPNSSSAADGHALFRGSIDTGDGNDSVNLNGESYSWYRTSYPGNGAWVDLGAGNDSVTGTDADDVLIGGAGSDVLRGDAGADVYLVSAAGGVDSIHDDRDQIAVDWGAGVDRSAWSFNDEMDVMYGGSGGLDRVEFDQTVQRSLLSHRFRGLTLDLLHNGTRFLEIDYRPESLAAHLSGAASGAMAGVESFRFNDGTVISLRELVATTPVAPAEPIVGTDGDDHLVGTPGNDTLVGGAGNDQLGGATGSDVYVFSARFGADHVSDWIDAASSGDVNEIRFTDRLPSQVFATRDDWNVYLIDKTSGDRMAIAGTWNLPTDADAGLLSSDWRVSFADGTVWTAANVAAAMDPRRTSVLDDVWYGSEADEIADGQQGNDILQGNGGNDILRGREGADQLRDSRGNNLLDGGSGDDDLVADAGTSVLIGGAGVDFINACVNPAAPSSPRLILFNAADGQDTVALSQVPATTSVISIGGGLNEGTVQLRSDGGAVVLDFGSGAQMTLLDMAFNGAAGALVLQVIDVNSIRRFDLAAVLSDYRAARDEQPGLQSWPVQTSLQSHALASSTDTAIGGLVAYRYAIDGSLATVPNATIQEYLAAPGFGADAQSIFGLGITGTDGNDSLLGTARDDSMRGLAGNDTLDGGAGADTLDGGAGSDSLRGGTGNDTYIVDAATDVIFERANEGTDSVRSSVSWSLGSNVENLTLIGAAAINGTGNSLANVLIGNGANNALNGGAGADTLQGGAGDDTYTVDNAADVVIESANEGADRVNASVTTTLWVHVESLTLTGTSAINGIGNELSNTLTGNGSNNSLGGGAGDDTLNGGAGADTMSGGVGNDTYVVDSASDVVNENADEGIDTVQSSVNRALGGHLENLTLTGAAATVGTGNGLNNVLTGNGIGNTLDAGAGDDTLNGGAGVDTMIGGTGNDLYVVNTASDVVAENANEGVDTVQSSATLTLAANVENLTLMGSGNLSGTGNALANLLVGNSGNNTLDGGAGVDMLRGGAGNDSYVLDDAGDVVIELADEGLDLVRAGVSAVLAAHVENLTLTGTGALNGTGNALDNLLTGNSANNMLVGGAGNDTLNGGAGNDTMTGGVGNDTYVVNAVADVVTEAADEGIDSVQSSITLTLVNHIENLTLTGSGNLNGTGNLLDNMIVGNGGNNALSGAAGNDTYQGGAGNDTLVDNSTTSNDVYRWGSGQGSDTINDAGGSDRIELSSGVTADQVSLVRNGNHLQLRIGGAAEALTVLNWYTSAASRIETILLADGTLIDAGTMAPLSLAAPRAVASRQTPQMRRVVGDAVVERDAHLLTAAMSVFAARGDAMGETQWHRVRDPMHLTLATPE